MFKIKIVNAYIVYDLDACPRNPTNNSKFKNCFFGATSIVKNSDKENWVYIGYRLTFDGADSCNFGNDFDRNIVVFGVNNSL